MAADRRLFVAAAGTALAAAMLLLAGVPAPPAPGAAHRSTALTAVTARAPRTQPEAVALVHACQQATADDLTLLAELARRDDPLTAGNAIAALGRLGRAADPGLLPLLRDPRPRVRHEMITAIGRSRAVHAVPHLEPLLADPDPVTQQLTIVALADLGAEEPLRRFVQNPAADPIARLFAEAVMAPHSRPTLLSSTGSDN